MNNRAEWVIDPPAVPGGPRRFARRALQQPGEGGKVLVSAVASIPDPSRPPDSPLPVVRPVGADLDDETIDIRLAPGLKLDNWNRGDYRLTDGQVLADQTRSLTLVGTLLPPGTDRVFRRMPVMRTSVANAEFAVTEQTAWRFDADRAKATVRVGVRVRRGTVFQFALRTPPAYAFVGVNSSPEDLAVHSARAGGVVTVEFAAAPGRASGRVDVRVRRPRPPSRHHRPCPSRRSLPSGRPSGRGYLPCVRGRSGTSTRSRESARTRRAGWTWRNRAPGRRGRGLPLPGVYPRWPTESHAGPAGVLSRYLDERCHPPGCVTWQDDVHRPRPGGRVRFVDDRRVGRRG